VIRGIDRGEGHAHPLEQVMAGQLYGQVTGKPVGGLDQNGVPGLELGQEPA
jgi:hypothetical protein